MGVSGQRHAPAALYPQGKDPRYSLYRRLVVPRAGLDTETIGKILCSCRESNLDRPVVQLVVRHYTDWATRLVLYSLTSFNLAKILIPALYDVQQFQEATPYRYLANTLKSTLGHWRQVIAKWYSSYVQPLTQYRMFISVL
jgi:hypothetical protein